MLVPDLSLACSHPFPNNSTTFHPSLLTIRPPFFHLYPTSPPKISTLRNPLSKHHTIPFPLSPEQMFTPLSSENIYPYFLETVLFMTPILPRPLPDKNFGLVCQSLNDGQPLHALAALRERFGPQIFVEARVGFYASLLTA
jgi:hypothetical protein